jgi:type III secretory pathway component EscS
MWTGCSDGCLLFFVESMKGYVQAAVVGQVVVIVQPFSLSA